MKGNYGPNQAPLTGLGIAQLTQRISEKRFTECRTGIQISQHFKPLQILNPRINIPIFFNGSLLFPSL